jgi:hypothetical protein
MPPMMRAMPVLPGAVDREDEGASVWQTLVEVTSPKPIRFDLLATRCVAIARPVLSVPQMADARIAFELICRIACLSDRIKRFAQVFMHPFQ